MHLLMAAPPQGEKHLCHLQKFPCVRLLVGVFLLVLVAETLNVRIAVFVCF